MSSVMRGSLRAATAVLVCATVGVIAPSALATTTTINFDGLSAGTALGTVGDATFVGSPTVFVPAHVATHSLPNALHTGKTCSGQACDQIEVDFSVPKRAVSVRVGLDDQPAPELGVPYQLTGFDSGGHVVAQSNGANTFPGGAYAPINTLVSIQSLNTDIVKVVISTGGTSVYPYNTASSARTAIDDLTFSDDSTPPPAAPTVTITSPPSGTTFDRPDQATVSGVVTAPAGISRFCLTTSAAATIPADCHSVADVDAQGHFNNLVVPGLHGGDNVVTAWVEDGALRDVHSAPVMIHIVWQDLALSNMEVTQAVQAQLPGVFAADFSSPRTAVYNGVPLSAGKVTVVRVWVGAHFDGGRPVPGVRVILTGTRNGVPLPGGPLSPVEGLRTITPANSVDSNVTPQQWADPASAYTFRLPASWTTGGISLQAVVNPPGYAPAATECDGCTANNVMTLTGVTFETPRQVTVTPLEMVFHDNRDGHTYAASDVMNTFSGAITVSPFSINVRPYQAVIDISSIGNSNESPDDMSGDALGRVDAWEASNSGNGIGNVIGVNQGVSRGLTSPIPFCCDPPRIKMMAVVESLRPLTSVSHEFFHQEGFRHAGENCPNAGGFAGVLAVSWPPDDMGRLHGVGTDTRVGSGGDAGALRIYDPSNSFDFMSYCTNIPGNGIPGGGGTGADGGDAWISPENWMLARHPAILHSGDDPVASDASVTGHVAARTGPVLRVFSILPATGGNARVLNIEPGFGPSSPASKAPGAVIKILSASGKTLSSTPVRLMTGHVNRGFVFQVASATVPAPTGATSLDIVEGNKVVAKRSRPRHVPRVRLLSPRGGKRIAAGGTTTVRWQVRDPDHVKLLASVDYSTNARKWHTVALGITGRSFAVPNTLLNRSAHGRFRVRVSDGWNEGTAVSGKLKVAGAAPRALVTNVAGSARIAAGSTVTLQGVGTDGTRAAHASQLHWFAGSRLVGRGRQVTVGGLRPGPRMLRLVVRASDGRTATSRVRLIVMPAKQALIVRKAPAAVSPRARSVSLRLAATTAGVLIVGHQRVHVGRVARTVHVKVRPSSTPLAMRLVLRAGGRESSTTLTVRR